MPTGPSSNQYIIPDILLSDTFNEWLTVTNTDIIEKLNFLKVYTATGTGGITVDTLTNGEAMIGLDEIIPGPHTFTGNITFNGTVTTVNSTEMTVDDYNLVLGHTAGGSGGSDAEINAAGGGGIILKGLTTDKEFLWKTGPDAWHSSESLRLAANKRFLSGDNTFRLHTTTGGLNVRINGSGTTYDTMIFMGTSAGATAEIARIKTDTTVEIYNGVNRKRFYQSGAGFTFGQAIRPIAGGFTLARANNAENAEAIGLICGVNGDTFDVMFQGEISGDFTTVLGSTLSAGEVYFLSAVTAGYLSASYPAAIPSNITKAMLLGFGPTQGYVLHYVGVAATGGIDVDLGSNDTEGVQTIIAGSSFENGDVVRINDAGTGYAKADATSLETAEAVGVVVGIVNPSTYRVKTFGVHTFNTGITLATGEGYQAGISAGQVYFLSTDFGRMTLNQPTSGTTVIKPMMLGLTNNKALILNRNPMIPATNGGNGGNGGGPDEPPTPVEGLVGKTFIPVETGQLDSNLFYPGQGSSSVQNLLIGADTELPDPNDGYYLYHLDLEEMIADPNIIPANATHVALQGFGQVGYGGDSSYSRITVGPFDNALGVNSYTDGSSTTIQLKQDPAAENAFFENKYCGDFIHNQFPSSGKMSFNEHIICKIGTRTVGGVTTNSISFLIRVKGINFIDYAIRIAGFYCESNISGDIPSTPKNKIKNPFFKKWDLDTFRKLDNPAATALVGGSNPNRTVAADGWTICAVNSANTIKAERRSRLESDTTAGLDSSCYDITKLTFNGSASLTDAVALFSNSIINARSVPNGKATLSFIARVTNGTQRIQAGFSRNYYNSTIANSNGLPESSYEHIGTVDLTSEWRRFFFTFDMPLLADGGALSTSNVHFILGHKTYTPPANPWIKNFNSMTNPNLLDYWPTSGTVIEFAHVQLEMGAVGTPIEVISETISSLDTDSIVSLGEGEHTCVADNTSGSGYTAFRAKMQPTIYNGQVGSGLRRINFKSKRGVNPTDPPVAGRANLIETNGTPRFIAERTINAGLRTDYGFYTKIGVDATAEGGSGVSKGGYSFYYIVDASIYPFPTDTSGNLLF